MNLRIKWTSFLFKLFISLFVLSFSLPQTWAGFIFEFDPLLTSEERYDDNLFLSSSNKRSDWITTISPGFTTSILHPRLNLTLEYQPNLLDLGMDLNSYTIRELEYHLKKIKNRRNLK